MTARGSQSPNHREGLSAISSITGTDEYVYSTNHALDVAVISGGGGGTQYVEGVTSSPATGTVAMGRYTTVAPTLTDGQLYGLQLDGSGNLKVSGSLSVGGTTDNSTFTAGSSTGTPAMGFYHSTIDTVTDGRSAAVGITSKRAMLVNLQTAAGVETGIAAAPLQVSLANTAANSTAVVVAGSGGALALDATLTGGTQQTKITDGTNVANNLKSDGTAAGQNSQLTAGTYLSVAFSTAIVANVASTDAGNYRWVSVDINTQGTTSTVTFQGSNDNSNWRSVVLTNTGAATPSATASTTTAAILFAGPLNYRYFRLSVTGIAAGTTAGTVIFSTLPSAAPYVAAGQAGTWTVDTELAAPVALGDGIATTTTAPVISYPVVFNGGTTFDRTRGGQGDGATATGLQDIQGRLFNNSTYDRARSVINATNSIGTGITAVGALAQFDDVSPTAITENQFGNLRMSANRNLYGTIRDAAGNERGANVNASNQLSVSVDNANVSTNLAQVNGVTTLAGNGASGTGAQRVTLASDSTGQAAPAANATTTGTSIYNNTALSSTKQAVNASAGNLYGYHIYNPNSAVMFVQLFNVASASVTVGTTPPTAVIAIPGLGWADATPGVPITFGTALTIAATTTSTGSGSPGTALLCNIWYK